ncbi:MAG: Isoquinoline 1-oxidoreductase subunit [Myxococcota bacterium]
MTMILSWFGLSCSHGPVAENASTPLEVRGLKNAAFYRQISDDDTRAVALFEEAGKVLLHPRCVNCHPATSSPLQTDAQYVHRPPVQRGSEGRGIAGMKCSTCHFAENVPTGERSVPGHPHWHLAPASMAWEDQSLADICAQLKDLERNGERTLQDITSHMATDGLVGWGWNPGRGRASVPGTQEIFGGLIRAWVEAGAACPSDEELARAQSMAE